MNTHALPHWDLSNVYPSLDSPEFRGAVDRVRVQVQDLEQYRSEHKIARAGEVPAQAADLAEIIAGWLDRMNAALVLADTLGAYLSGTISTDSYNTTARRLLSELEPVFVQLERQEILFAGWIGTVARQRERFEAALAVAGSSARHSFYLKEMVEQSAYLMTEAEETLAAELALSGIWAWSKLQGVITSQLKVPWEQNGSVEDLPVTVVQNLRVDPDETIRRRAYEAELRAWQSVREPLASCLNGVKGAVVVLNRHRGRGDALHQPLDQARIDRHTLEAMLGAMHDSFPAFRRYFQAKARLLGKETMAWWDLFAPLGQAGRQYTFGEAQEFIQQQFGTFSGRLVSLARRAFEQHWIDAEPRDGKRGGAFCMRVPAVNESRILCNFDGSLDQVLTLAHELGHAYHNECQVGKEPLQRRTPMTLAETASILNQTIITDALLSQPLERDEELTILEGFLSDAAQIIVDISSRYLFEKEVFERRAVAELSADDFCEIMLRAQKETYGEGLDPEYLNPYMWAWKPHYYRTDLSFYNFPYAFGLLFGLGLYVIYQEKGPAFLPAYDELLRNTGEGTAADLAAGFGLNIRRRAFWENSLKIIEARIERFESLC